VAVEPQIEIVLLPDSEEIPVVDASWTARPGARSKICSVLPREWGGLEAGLWGAGDAGSASGLVFRSRAVSVL
jgi:hypothetical protein